jgi:hypothetical protein
MILHALLDLTARDSRSDRLLLGDDGAAVADSQTDVAD